MNFFKCLQNERNKDLVNVFHCMGGKGRTGTIVSMLLINNKICSSAQVKLDISRKVK